jgi:hypothetical protein
MYVLDKRAGTGEWQEVFMSPNTRANKIRISSAHILDADGQSQPVYGLIHDAGAEKR